MGVPHIVSCCWCLGLETGTKVIAFIHLIVALCLVVVCSVYAYQFGERAGTAEDAGDGLYSTWRAIAAAVAGVSTAHVLLAGVLLYGVLKRRTCALRVWVFVMGALWAAAVLFDVVGALALGVNGSGSDMFLALLEAVLFFGVLAYCILCVYSYYLLLKSSEDMEGPHSTPY